MKVSVVIPNYNGEKYLADCLDALKKQSFKEFEVILVDNGSTDNSIETAKSLYEGIRIVALQENTGFAYAVNAGIKAAKGEYVILLNNDTIPFENFVNNQYKMIKDKKDIFSCSALMIDNKNRHLVDDAGDYYCALGWAFSDAKGKPVADYSVPREVFASCGGAAIYRRDMLVKLGMFDNSFFAYLEDIDVGYRARLCGYKNLYNPHARVYHIGSASSGSRYNAFKVKLSARNSIYLIRKNMPLWQIIINLPFILAGILIKLAFFVKKKLAFQYIKGLWEGISTKGITRTKASLNACVKVQVELYMGLKRRLCVK